jgi:hypothetical protein
MGAARWRNTDRGSLGWVLWTLDLGSRILGTAIWIYVLVQWPPSDESALLAAVCVTTLGAIANVIRVRREPARSGGAQH